MYNSYVHVYICTWLCIWLLQVDLFLAIEKKNEAGFALQMAKRLNRIGLCLGVLYFILCCWWYYFIYLEVLILENPEN